MSGNNMKKFFQKKKIYLKKQGITVLVASLVASILLAVGLSIFNTTLKDLFFAATARESEIAFYAADMGAECAQYWDIQGGVFATSTDSYLYTHHPTDKQCAGQDITTGGTGSTQANWNMVAAGSPPSAVTTFRINITSTSTPPVQIACAEVTLTKKASSAGAQNLTNPDSDTTISALGYSDTCSNKDANPRSVQRGVQFSY